MNENENVDKQFSLSVSNVVFTSDKEKTLTECFGVNLEHFQELWTKAVEANNGSVGMGFIMEYMENNEFTDTEKILLIIQTSVEIGRIVTQQHMMQQAQMQQLSQDPEFFKQVN